MEKNFTPSTQNAELSLSVVHGLQILAFTFTSTGLTAFSKITHMEAIKYFYIICSLAFILQGCRSHVIELPGIPADLQNPLEIPPYNQYECYAYKPIITQSDRILSYDSILSKYVEFQEGWFTLRFIESVKQYEMLLLNLDEGIDAKMEKNTAIKYLSIGFYTEHRNYIILKDSENGMKIRLKKISKDTLQTNNEFFLFLKKKKLSYETISFDAEKYCSEETSFYSDSITEYPNTDYSDTTVHETEFPIGIFTCDNNDLFLQLNKDSSYRYYVCGLLLSEGIWEQKGQRMDLHDKHLKHTFHGKITNQGIWSGYWPGDMEGTFLKRIEE